MVSGKFKSRTFRRVYTRTPGAKTVIHYKTRKHSKAQCKDCGSQLPGVPTGPKAEIGKLPRNQRRPERPYGGVLCSACMRKAIKARVGA